MMKQTTMQLRRRPELVAALLMGAADQIEQDQGLALLTAHQLRNLARDLAGPASGRL